MKIKSIKKILASIGVLSLVAIVGISSLGMAMANNEEQPAKNYVSVEPNQYGGNHYEFSLDGGLDENAITIGRQEKIGDYIYTYGYKWNNNGSTPTKGNLSNWTKIEEDKTGWGVAVIAKNKTSYENVCDMIDGAPVKYANNLFAGCTNLVIAPTIPAFATDTTGMFSGCTKLTKVTIPNSLTTLGAEMFKGCTALRHVYIPNGVKELAGTSASNSVFYNCNSNLTIYCGFGEMEREANYWNYISSSKTANTKYYFSYHAELAYEKAMNP